MYIYVRCMYPEVDVRPRHVLQGEEELRHLQVAALGGAVQRRRLAAALQVQPGHAASATLQEEARHLGA